VICPRCKREAVGWPLKRADVCSLKSWEVCIREPHEIERKKRLKVKRRRK
jgi:hypothetical protein